MHSFMFAHASNKLATGTADPLIFRPSPLPVMVVNAKNFGGNLMIFLSDPDQATSVHVWLTPQDTYFK